FFIVNQFSRFDFELRWFVARFPNENSKAGPKSGAGRAFSARKLSTWSCFESVPRTKRARSWPKVQIEYRRKYRMPGNDASQENSPAARSPIKRNAPPAMRLATRR